MITEVYISPEEGVHLEAVRQWIYRHTGLYYPEQKRTLLYQRLQTLCWRLNIADIKTLNQHLRLGDKPGLAVEIANTVSTNHTYFYREEKVIEFFEKKIVPVLPPNELWRIWSAAAATGEEAYTIAIILSELFGPVQLSQRAAILGTDISQAAIQQAERGIYTETKIKQLPPHLFQRYFKPIGLGQWQVQAETRKVSTFRRLNLMSAPWPFKNLFHVIFCRNVLYYFDQESQLTLIERLYDVTAAGGWLLTSVTESLIGFNTRWQQVTSGVYRKTG